MQPSNPVSPACFAACMATLGPWPGPGTPVCVAVSGGADSMALAILARGWRPDVVGLVVDHGLRAESRQEAEQTVARLSRLGMPARLLVLEGLARGPRMAERARRMRYQALFAACRALGALDLLVAHHAGDQAETVLMRQQAASGDDGLAAMAVATDMADVRLVRPLLGVGKAALYATVQAAGVQWVEDPSNADLRTARARARHALAEDSPLAGTLVADALQAGQARQARNMHDARWLAAHARFHPGGWVVLPPELAPPRLLSALIRVVGGGIMPRRGRRWQRLRPGPGRPRWPGSPSCPGGTGSGSWPVRRQVLRPRWQPRPGPYGTGVSSCMRPPAAGLARGGGGAGGGVVAAWPGAVMLARAAVAHAARAMA
ncbi:tRNA lysidine(34) synthetase TilS [Komagataeibacter nataicola]|uniref:tRNA lysidine(34) synthetase TilS n=1 Tax=Komagataeibacter nataicola TaxID=265960 RepID=UPI0028AA1284|nr:tRNA lysidine(34) synthetase TilS [Komagataeibacter nataicola]WNM09316.1 tRNA lysidine(34) synthetase TilS [Komagataeibacter nataicola]